jgi:hypothetical protein
MRAWSRPSRTPPLLLPLPVALPYTLSLHTHSHPFSAREQVGGGDDGRQHVVTDRHGNEKIVGLDVAPEEGMRVLAAPPRAPARGAKSRLLLGGVRGARP